MKISAKIDYACRALLELSLHWPSSDPVQINTIAKRQGIPIKFLTQILISLRDLGFVQSIRGKNGGYLLACEPKDIQLATVIDSLGSGGFEYQEKNRKYIFNQIWAEIDGFVMEKLKNITFEAICNQQKQHDKAYMFHI